MTDTPTGSPWGRRLPRLLAVGAGALLLSLSAGAAQAGGDHFRVVSAGSLGDYATAVDGPFDDAYATATIHSRHRGSTVTFEVRGIDKAVAGTRYGAHLHLGPCVPDNSTAALAHYNTDVLAGRIPPRVDPTTEVWLDFTVTAKGRGSAVARVPFVPEPGNRAIVIHADETHPDGTAGGRLACLPLVWVP